jgi:protein TonB
MFETVAPDAFARRDRHVLYETLPASIAVHLAAGAVIVVVAMSQVAFPLQPPKVIVGYIASELGEPVPPPPPPPAPKQPDARPEPKLQTPMDLALTPMETAPATIPDEVEQMPPSSQIRLVSATVDKLVPAAGRSDGVKGGVASGLSGGVLGGVGGGIVGGIVGGDGRMHFERDSRLPLFAEEHPYPEYPDTCINQRLEGLVIVKYVIGKDGKVNDVSIIHHAAHKEFDIATLDAIRRWRFRPLIIDGEPMEVVHELTVFFRLY